MMHRGPLDSRIEQFPTGITNSVTHPVSMPISLTLSCFYHLCMLRSPRKEATCTKSPLMSGWRKFKRSCKFKDGLMRK